MKIFKLFLAGALLVCGAFSANAQNFGGPQMDPQQMVQMRVDQLKQSFDLTAEQIEQATELYTKQTAEFQKIFEGGNPDFSQFGKIMENEVTEMKKILTEDQFKAWQKQRDEQMAQFGGGF